MNNLARLLQIMQRLRAPDGCPWDKQQTFATIAPYTVEEAYEVADAIARHDLDDLRDELGDLLFQVVFHARLAEEQGAFDFDAVAGSIADKLIRRHPHVFAAASYADHDELHAAWEAHKAEERANKSASAPASVLDDIPLALPALSRALKIGKRVARVGFDWPDHGGALDKIEEECAELRHEVESAASAAQVTEEFGDLLFAMVNLARKLRIDPEAALQAANRKFEQRFRAVEARLAARGKRPEESDLEEMDGLWEEVKRAQRVTD